MIDFQFSDQLASHLIAWWDKGHAELPWRNSKEPYSVWVAEVMLQQTQIATVINYYERWMVLFPTIETLAAAPLERVFKAWEGLGYYRRARHLHSAAQFVVSQLDGQLPQDVQGLQKLKGIGRYTAGAIASIAYDIPAPVLDGNVIRVLSRLTDLSADVTLLSTEKQLWELAAKLVSAERPGDYNQALMELGQTICLPIKPQCHHCPVESLCLARERGTQLERPVRPPRARTPHYDVVAGVIFREDGRFLIARRPLDKLLGGLWEFPGGKQEKGESLEEALVREIDEELGVEIRPSHLLLAIKHAYTHFRITLHTFQATYVAGEPQHLGVIDHAWVSLAELEHFPFAQTDRQIIDHLTELSLGAQSIQKSMML